MTRKHSSREVVARISLRKIESWIETLDKFLNPLTNSYSSIEDLKEELESIEDLKEELEAVHDEAFFKKQKHTIREMTPFEVKVYTHIISNEAQYSSTTRGRLSAYKKALIIKQYLEGLSYYTIAKQVECSDFSNLWYIIKHYIKDGILKACCITNPFIKKEPLDATPEAVEAFRKKHNLTQMEFCELYEITINEFKSITKLNQKLKGDNHGQKSRLQNNGNQK